ncbi:MAG: beta-galactosidase, partial [Planctomycetota bacterium]
MTSKHKLTSGPVVIAGNWEPLIFRRRRNDSFSNLTELYEKEHTEEAVQAMKKAGVNLLITHYQKGFGLKAEAEDVSYAKKLIDLCHKNEIKVGGYIGDTYVLETMLSEDSDAASWMQVGADGTPIRFAGTQPYRFKWCVVNPAYEKYMHKVLKQAIEDGLDMIHLDNYLQKPEPYSCHCKYCVETFRGFLKNKYSDAELKERIGHTDLTNVLPPVFISPLYIAWNLDLITDPITQEWTD